jgi:hypothetical protein
MKNSKIKEKFTKDLFQNASTGYILTPPALANEMINTLPDEVFLSETTTFLDPICKNGTFLVEIAERLYERGHSINNIQSRIYTIDSSLSSLNVAEGFIKKIINSEARFEFDSKNQWIESYYDRLIFVISQGKFKTFRQFLNIILLNKKDLFLMTSLQDNIKSFIEAYEKVSKLESKLFGEVFTPRQLIDEMLDTLPSEVWKNKDLKWLDPAVGIGNFPAAILDRLMVGLDSVIPNEDDRRKWILEEMLYMCDISIKNLFLLYKLFDENNEFKLNVYRGSFLTEDFDKCMKEVWGLEGFDVVVGNPPYQKNTETFKDENNKQGGFWWEFIENSFKFSKENTIISMVVPTSIFSSGGFGTKIHKVSQIIKNGFNFSHIKNDVTDHFDVGIRISYFTIQKKNIELCTLVDSGDEISISIDKPIPYDVTKVNVSIVNKCINLKNKWNFTEKDNSQPTDSVVKINGGRFKKYEKVFVGKNCDTKHKAQTLILEPNKDDIYRSIFLNKLHHYIFVIFGGESGQSSTGILQRLPYLPADKIWTQPDIYQHFNLTQEEIDLIEKTIKD